MATKQDELLTIHRCDDHHRLYLIGIDRHGPVWTDDRDQASVYSREQTATLAPQLAGVPIGMSDAFDD